MRLFLFFSIDLKCLIWLITIKENQKGFKMKKTLLSVLIAATGIANAQTISPFVIEGTDANPDQYSFHARIVDITDPENIKDFCGGTIVSDQFILTAANCLADDSNSLILEKENLGIVIKNFDTKNTYIEEIKTIRKIYTHDEFANPNETTSENDIALIELEVAITDNVSSVVLPETTDYDSFYGTNLTVETLGLGLVNQDQHEEIEDADSPTVVQVGHNKIIGQDFCSAILSLKNDDKKFCTVSEFGDGLHYLEGIQHPVTNEVEAYSFGGEHLYAIDHAVQDISIYLPADGDDTEYVPFHDQEDPALNGDINKATGKSCYGDEGSYVGYVNTDGDNVQLGIVSTITGECRLDNPVMITRLNDFTGEGITGDDLTWYSNIIYGNQLSFDPTAENNFGHSFGDTNFICQKEEDCYYVEPEEPTEPENPEEPTEPTEPVDPDQPFESNDDSGGSTNLLTLFGLAVIATRRLKKKQ